MVYRPFPHAQPNPTALNIYIFFLSLVFIFQLKSVSDNSKNIMVERWKCPQPPLKLASTLLLRYRTLRLHLNHQTRSKRAFMKRHLFVAQRPKSLHCYTLSHTRTHAHELKRFLYFRWVYTFHSAEPYSLLGQTQGSKLPQTLPGVSLYHSLTPSLPEPLRKLQLLKVICSVGRVSGFKSFFACMRLFG